MINYVWSISICLAWKIDSVVHPSGYEGENRVVVGSLLQTPCLSDCQARSFHLASGIMSKLKVNFPCLHVKFHIYIIIKLSYISFLKYS